MRSHWKRLLWAACLSLTCAGATLGWYYGTEKKNEVSNEPPLALASHAGGEVLRRPPTRLLWQTVSTGDNLYNGETIRTADQGELRIQFEDGRYIELEPESLIVLQKKQGQINLDLLDGSAFVNAKAQTGGKVSGMVLNSGGGTVDLTDASASLSKGSGNRIDLHVMEGKAKVKGADGKEHEVESGKSSTVSSKGASEMSSLVVLQPTPQKPIFINPDAQTPILFKWKGYPPAWRVTLLTGQTRKALKTVASTDRDGQSEISAKMALGKYWWKLVAKDPATGQIVSESPIDRVDIQGRYPPALLVPNSDGVVPIEKSPASVTFNWRGADEAGQVKLEVSEDPEMSKNLFEKTLTKEESVVVPALKSGVHYYARLSASYSDLPEPLASKVRHFTLQLPAKKDPVQIVWKVPPEKRDQIFAFKPTLEMAWESQNRKDEITNYRVTVENEDKSDKAPMQIDVKVPLAKAAVPTAGRYLASVEAYNKDGEMIGKSEPLALNATAAPILPAPVLQPVDGDLQAGSDGKTELQWTVLDSAKGYWVTVMNKSGKQLLHRKYDVNSAKLKNLMPGDYTVHVEAVDVYGRTGKDGDARKLRVPASSGIKSPKVKKVQVD